MKDRKRVTIIQTGHHFLYLPLHYAIEANFFGCVPDVYEIDLWCSPKKTDRDAYLNLKNGRAENHDYIGFAIADPAELLHDTDHNINSPVILAGLITNSSFWAVDRRTHSVRVVSDLGEFDHIIAFPEGTTSNGIAKRIYRDAKKNPSIISVNFGEELTTLTTTQKGTVALTPDLLALDKLLADKSDIYYVDLALGKTLEYNNVLVTALISRTDVIHEHPELVQGVIKAIQRATMLVRFADPAVIKFAMETYGESESRIVGALRRAEDAQVFPATIEVNQTHWEKAARAASDAAGREFDDREHDRATAVYKSAVAPYLELTRKAIRDDLVPRLKNNLESQIECKTRFQSCFEWSILGLIVGLPAGAALAEWMQVPLAAVSISVLLIMTFLTIKMPRNWWVQILQIVWLLIGLLLICWLLFKKPASPPFVPPLWEWWFGIEATILLAAATLSGRQKR